MNFTNEELVNMVYALGEADRNCLLASRIYRQKYPLARHPKPEAFEKVRRRFEENCSVKYKVKSYENCHIMNEDTELQVLLAIEENPQISTRRIGLNQGISKSSVNRIIKKHQFHPYHLCLHQSLTAQDYENRTNFCNIFSNMMEEIPNFYNIVLFSDEATFNNIGVVNKHNMHYYARENPRWVRQVDFQHQWSLNVWGGVIGDQVIGPFFFEDRLNGERYRRFLEDDLPTLMEDVNLETRRLMYFQHDGAPSHFHQNVRQYLNHWLGNRWIGRGSNIPWPARSPDLTPLDFFLWGYTKQKVYQELPTTVEDMKNRIQTAFKSISPPMMNRVKENFARRLRACIRERGNIFEHVL